MAFTGRNMRTYVSYTSLKFKVKSFKLRNRPGGRVIVDFGARCFYDTGIPSIIITGVF
jgi:hypothetical protein